MRVLILVVGLLVGCVAEERPRVEPGDSAGDTAAVRGTFERYRAALEGRDAERARAVLDSGSIAHYGRLRDLALSGDEPTVRTLPLLDQFLVLGLRHRLPVDSLQNLSVAGIVAYSLRPDWIAEQMPGKQMKLGRIEFDREEATAEAYSEGENSGQLFYFRKQGRWKVDLASTTRSISERLESTLAFDEANREKVLSAMFEKAVGKPLTAELWKPPVRIYYR